MDRFQVTSRLTEFWIDAGKTATVTNIGSTIVYGSPDAPPTSTTTAAWSLAPGASRVEDVGAVWVLTANGTSSTLTVEPIASGLATDTGTGVPSAIGSGSGGSVVTVKDEGSALTARSFVNFVGSGVAATDDGTNIVVTIPGGGGTASTTTFSPSGTIAATDVQAAVLEAATDAIAREAANLGLPKGLTGATAATRYAGATASGAPASGAFLLGDFAIDQTGSIYVCTAAGSPGTWKVVDGVPAVVAAGTVGATPSLDLAAQTNAKDVVYTATLAVDTTLTVTNLTAGAKLQIGLLQDTSGFHTFALTAAGSTGQSIQVLSTPSSQSLLSCVYDGTDLYVKGI